MGRSTALAVLTAAVLVFTGCTAAPPPAPAPPPSGPLTLREALGDPTTVDFCGLLDFPEIEKTQRLVSVPTPSMGACSFRTGSALISFGFPEDRARERLAGATPVAEPPLSRGLRMVRTDLQGQPVLHLLFTDDSSLRVGTFFDSRETSGSDALAVATKTAESAARALVAGEQAAHLDYRADSLARLDACSAFWSDAEVSARLGVPVSGKGDLSRHQCLWGEQGAERIVRLEFGLGPRPKGTAGVREETVGGRKSFVQEVSGGCTVLTGHIGGPDASRNQVEHAILAVQAPDACGIARELAAAAWPKLPA
ncbi:hypothetical protein [Amycolatopsis decaplanina]|uniref:DUF3558 domain-containing protein n=1 Tax=Amycolatopsis decaplanina DSM 44594 TaxID=1284240 RepID=M2YZT5_9PSEU|nr:hypothetical protein [Amycolatopsis decaplanina]EME54168.1 hypothetical protein H074_29513 [Amycolatopsis decaplanina DSM 44594]